MTVWLWLLLPVAGFVLTRLANTRLIVPAWREDRISSGTATQAVAAMRGLTMVALIAALVLIAGLPLVPGLAFAVAAGGIYFAVSRRSIRRMFDAAQRPPLG
jgi:heme A synthase